MEFFDLLDKCNKNCNKGRSKQFFLGNILNKGGGVGIAKLFVKFWWPFFLAMKFTFLFLYVPRGGGPPV